MNTGSKQIVVNVEPGNNLSPHEIHEDQGDGFKITTPHGSISYRPVPNERHNEVWWVESHKKDHGSKLLDLMQHHHPADSIDFGVMSRSGKGLMQRYAKANPHLSIFGGTPHEGQFDPFGHGDDHDEEHE